MCLKHHSQHHFPQTLHSRLDGSFIFIFVPSPSPVPLSPSFKKCTHYGVLAHVSSILAVLPRWEHNFHIVPLTTCTHYGVLAHFFLLLQKVHWRLDESTIFILSHVYLFLCFSSLQKVLKTPVSAHFCAWPPPVPTLSCSFALSFVLALALWAFRGLSEHLRSSLGAAIIAIIIKFSECI